MICSLLEAERSKDIFAADFEKADQGRRGTILAVKGRNHMRKEHFLLVRRPS